MCTLSVTPHMAIGSCSFLHLSFFCLPTSEQGELLSAAGHPRRDADPRPAGGEEAAAHPAERAARSRQGSGSAARATTEGQGQRDNRGSGSER